MLAEHQKRKRLAAGLGTRAPKDLTDGLHLQAERERRDRRLAVKLGIAVLVLVLLWSLSSYVVIPWIQQPMARDILADGLDITVFCPRRVWQGRPFDVVTHVRRKPGGPQAAIVEFHSSSKYLHARNGPWHHRFDFSHGDTEDWTLSLSLSTSVGKRWPIMQDGEKLGVKVRPDEGVASTKSVLNMTTWPFMPILEVVVVMVAALGTAIRSELIGCIRRGLLTLP